MTALTDLLTDAGAAAPGTDAAPAAPAPPPALGPVRVNLLPPEVLVRRGLRRVQRVTAVALGAALLVAGGAWALGAHDAATAQAGLDDVRARTATLQHQQAAYADAPRVAAELAAVRGARTRAMAQDVAWQDLLGRVAAAAPDDVWLVGVQAGLDAVGGAASAPAAPAAAAGAAAASPAAAPGGIGALTISAKTTSYEGVAAYLDALGNVRGVSDPTLTTSARDGASTSSVIAFTITATASTDALSHLFDATTGQDGN